MKSLIVIATVAVTALNAASGFAESCRIAPCYEPQRPVCEPEPRCHIAVLPPVCPPVRTCYIKPSPPVCPPVQHCRISICPPEPSVCVVPPQKMCHKCPGQVCHCRKEVPVCRIKPCEPVHHVCRIRPCEHVEPGYTNPGFTVPEPPKPPVELPELQSGQEVTIDGQQFGFQQGRVAVQIGGLTLEAQVTGWSETQVRALLPVLPLSSATAAQVVVLGADGRLADQLEIMLVSQSMNVASR
jgi:hypothetical protein